MNLENEWTVYRTRFLVRACQLTEPLVFTDILGREHCGEPGDYLVEPSAGCFRITARKIFEDVYVPLDSSRPSHANEQVIRPEPGHRSEPNRERKQVYSCREGAENSARFTA